MWLAGPPWLYVFHYVLPSYFLAMPSTARLIGPSFADVSRIDADMMFWSAVAAVPTIYCLFSKRVRETYP